MVPARWPLLLALCSCSAEPTIGLEVSSNPIVYGMDDRVDYFEEPSAEVRGRLGASLAVIARQGRIVGSDAGGAARAPTLSEAAGVCPEEPFARQPAAAFCSAVLVDWDLVLTASHCVRVFALSELEVVFGYYYREPEQLDVRPEDVFEIAEIVAEEKSDAAAVPRLDYAFLRLNRRVLPPRAPAPIRLAPMAESGEAIVAMGAGGGVPLKIDRGATIRAPRSPTFDYFVADTDTSHGASGGGAFASDLALLGVLARGGQDFFETEAACNVALRADPELAQEEFTYAARARDALCAKDPGASSLCRPECTDACQALPPADQAKPTGCAMSHDPRGAWPSVTCFALLGAAAALRIRKPRRARNTSW